MMPRPVTCFILLALAGCDRLYMPLWGTGTSKQSVNVMTAGQSNMTLRINDTDGIPTYFKKDLETKGVRVNQIDLAVGGTWIDAWTPGGSLYPTMVEAGLKQKHTDILLFWQGEAEAISGDPVRAEAWGRKFTQMVLQLRKDLNEPNLRVIFCQIGATPTLYGTYPVWQTVQEEQQKIFLPNVTMVKTDDQDFAGWLHTDEVGYRAIAYRIAQLI